MTATRFQIHPLTGEPRRKNGHARPEMFALQSRAQRPANGRRRPIEASYDAARDSDEFVNYWANADALDADSAHSKGVRTKLVTRSRYEVGNNGYADGITQTHATFVVGVGPRLRMQSKSKDFNNEVEAAFKHWAEAVQQRRKLWCQNHAKTQDGEGIGLMRFNPAVRDPVKLDYVLIETEQCTTPYLNTFTSGQIDGVRFDPFGNPLWYDVLPHHPGGSWGFAITLEPEQVPARFVMHWYLLRRPGQHRGVPEFKSTLNTGAGSRRFREATVGAAESAADIAGLVHTSLQPDELDPMAPFSSIPFEKRMLMALPQGWDAKQMQGEHPNAEYSDFIRQQISETARPKSMPYNLAACDSSTYSFASGKLDTLGYFAAIDGERQDGNDLVLEPQFALWWYEAVLVYGWDADPRQPPPHTWDWPRHPIIDEVAHADANDKKLRNGSLSLSKLYADAGLDFEDEIEELARDYGVTADEMRVILRKTIFTGAAEPPPAPPGSPAVPPPGDAQQPRTVSGFAAGAAHA